VFCECCANDVSGGICKHLVAHVPPDIIGNPPNDFLPVDLDELANGCAENPDFEMDETFEHTFECHGEIFGVSRSEAKRYLKKKLPEIGTCPVPQAPGSIHTKSQSPES